jgi:hypothetical protein
MHIQNTVEVVKISYKDVNLAGPHCKYIRYLGTYNYKHDYLYLHNLEGIA